MPKPCIILLFEVFTIGKEERQNLWQMSHYQISKCLGITVEVCGVKI